jgi:hypothetical protein
MRDKWVAMTDFVVKNGREPVVKQLDGFEQNGSRVSFCHSILGMVFSVGKGHK